MSIDAQIDEIYTDFDCKFTAGNFAAVDAILADTNPEPLEIAVALGMVTASFPARDRLQQYVPFRERCRACFGGRADALLRGL